MSTRPSLIINLPKEVHLNILTYLRAFDLSSLQQTCRFYNDREMITLTVQTFAKVVYPKELTDGYETAPPLFGRNKAWGRSQTTTRRQAVISAMRIYVTWRCLFSFES
jgi:hypothetical protein